MAVDDVRGATNALIATTPLAQEVEFLAVKAFADGTRMINARLRDVGLRARTYAVLALACSDVELTQRDLGVALELDPSQIVGLINELEEAGLVERTAPGDDRRRRTLRATFAGTELFARARTIVAETEAEALSMLTPAERDVLRALLRKITFATEPAPQGHPGDVTLLYLIKQVELAVRAHLDDITAEARLTALQYTALTVLERHPGITSSQLARNSFVRPQTMAQMIGSLEDLGLIVRERDPQSQRQMLTSLTTQGREVLARLRRPVSELESTMIGDLDEAQIASLRHALHVCREALGLPAR